MYRCRRALPFLLLAAAVASAPVARWWQARGADDSAVDGWLERRLPEFRMQNATLRDTLALLAEQAPGVDLVVEWEALARVGVTPESVVSCWLRQIKLDKVLRTILDEVGGGVTRLDYTTEGGRVIISTQRELLSRSTVRRYDVRDFFRQVPPRDTQNHRELAQAISTLVTDVVASDSWAAGGGEFASLRLEDGWLVVRQTRDNHDGIRRLLDQLHETTVDPLYVLTGEYLIPWR
jgi:hypothetical protein